MDWLNYHHLQYFWAVARAGSLRSASEMLHVSQPSISSQIKQLESDLGYPLFKRSGRGLALTEEGALAFTYAEEIFGLGQEMLGALKGATPSSRPRVSVGLTDAVPKLVAHQILAPLLNGPQAFRLAITEGKMDDLLGLVAAHRLDVILASEPPPSGARLRVFSQELGSCSIGFFGAPSFQALHNGFPASLSGQPLLLPSQGSLLRRALDAWLREQGVEAEVVAEFDDPALMKVFAAGGIGVIALPMVARHEAGTRYDLQHLGTAESVRETYQIISPDRRMTHPAVLTMSKQACETVFGAGGGVIGLPAEVR
ncbi:MAG: LysR family transcriptional regulator [Verrucomicrobiales bacterium]